MERKLAVAFGLGVTRCLSAPIFPILQSERDEAEEFFARHGIDDHGVLAAIHPGGMGAHKRWPAERFGRVACWLSENLGARVVVVGGPENERIMERVRSAGRGEAVVSAPFLSLGAVAALLERCSLFLTNDSGPMHLAAALGVPTVAIFGQTNHDRYAPLLPESRKECSYADPEHCPEDWTGRENEECRKSDCTHVGCLEAVSVDEVVGKLETLCSRIGLFYHMQPVDRPDVTTCTVDVDDRQPGEAEGPGSGGRSVEAADAGGGRQKPCAHAVRARSGNGTGGSGDTAGLPPADAGYITRRARERAIGLISRTDGAILDVACGKGYLIRDLTEGHNGSRRVLGVDISMEQLRSAKVFEGGGNGSSLIRGDIGRLPFRSDMFDATICVNTFLNLAGGDTLTACLFEMARVTRAGGTVLVELRNARNPLVGFRFLIGKLLHRVPLHVHRLGDVLAAGKKAGLVLTSKHSVGPTLGPFSYSHILEFEKEDE
jgi:SAM-dependent methyltransferase